MQKTIKKTERITILYDRDEMEEVHKIAFDGGWNTIRDGPLRISYTRIDPERFKYVGWRIAEED